MVRRRHGLCWCPSFMVGESAPLLGAPGLHAFVESLFALFSLGCAISQGEGEAQRVAFAVACVAPNEFNWDSHGFCFALDFAFSLCLAFAFSLLALAFAFPGASLPFSFGWSLVSCPRPQGVVADLALQVGDLSGLVVDSVLCFVVWVDIFSWRVLVGTLRCVSNCWCCVPAGPDG